MRWSGLFGQSVGGTSTDVCIMLGGEIQQREVVDP